MSVSYLTLCAVCCLVAGAAVIRFIFDPDFLTLALIYGVPLIPYFAKDTAHV